MFSIDANITVNKRDVSNIFTITSPPKPLDFNALMLYITNEYGIENALSAITKSLT